MTGNLRWIVPLVVSLAATSAVPAPVAAQWLDPDGCVTCRDKTEHFAAGAALDMLARGPWVARSFRDRWWKRVALTTVIASGYEVIEAGAARREGKAGRPGYGISPVDIAATAGGALALEAVWTLASRALGRHH